MSSHAEELIRTFKRFKRFTITASEPFFMYGQKQRIMQGYTRPRTSV